jgi:uncharacterized protein YegL
MSINIPENKSISSATKKLPCVILIDTSGSMSADQQKLVNGMEELKKYLSEDEMACSSVEVSIVTFDNEARVAEPFGPINDLCIPSINCNGMTAMHAAVDIGLKTIDKRRSEYKQYGLSSYRPWMYMLTDGGANDSDNGSFKELVRRQENQKLFFFPVAIGDTVDEKLLGSLHPDNEIFSIDRDRITKAFQWLSDSLSSVSGTKSGTVTLSDPEDFGLQRKHIQIDVGDFD